MSLLSQHLQWFECAKIFWMSYRQRCYNIFGRRFWILLGLSLTFLYTTVFLSDSWGASFTFRGRQSQFNPRHGMLLQDLLSQNCTIYRIGKTNIQCMNEHDHDVFLLSHNTKNFRTFVQFHYRVCHWHFKAFCLYGHFSVAYLQCVFTLQLDWCFIAITVNKKKNPHSVMKA